MIGGGGYIFVFRGGVSDSSLCPGCRSSEQCTAMDDSAPLAARVQTGFSGCLLALIPGRDLCTMLRVRSAVGILPGCKPARLSCVPARGRCQPPVLHAARQPHQGALQAAAKALLLSLATLTGPARAQAVQGAVDIASVWQSVNSALVLGFLTFYAASAWNNSKLYSSRWV